MTSVTFILPGDVDDTTVPSGGNRYDREVCRGLRAAGWTVREVPIAGAWPSPGADARRDLTRVLAGQPDHAVVLLDGLVAGGVPDLVAPESERLRLVALVHLPLARETGLDPERAAALDALERRTLRAMTIVIATSEWTRGQLIDHYGLSPDRVRVAAPGVDPAPLAPGTDGAARLLCVAAVTPRKGQHVLVEALATLTDREWTCHLVGSRDRAATYVDRLHRTIDAHGLTDRIPVLGPRTGDDLEAEYAQADLTLLPSHAETYGMVVTESLARGIPVVATDVDGLPEALGLAPDGTLPGLLVPAGDPPALARALGRWLDEPMLRQRLRTSARERRSTLDGWDNTTRHVADALQRLPVGRAA
jgi:glycosyltransferase involved in cell wall biosynthesis